jgi:hypothetical protein
MGRIHKSDTQGEKTIELRGETTYFNAFSDAETDEHLARMGISDNLVEAAIAAAQAVLSSSGARVFIADIRIEEHHPDLKDACQCGARCTGWTCVPYEQCETRNGQRVCWSGHRRTCSSTSCNPCP